MLWGKYFWTTMHVAALGFPDVATDVTRQQYRAFYKGLGDVLPCSKCKKNFSKHFEELPIDLYLYDKNTLFTWTVEFHNIVNAETKKNKLSVAEAKEYYISGKYARFHEDKGKKENKLSDILILLNIVLLVILVLLIGWLIFKKLHKRGS